MVIINFKMDQPINMITIKKYNNYTVNELKKLIKDNKILHFGGNKKADYIKSLESHDDYEQSLKSLSKFTEDFKKDLDNIKELKQKTDDTIELTKDAIVKLKSKENKTNEDYENIIKLYDGLIKIICIKGLAL